MIDGKVKRQRNKFVSLTRESGKLKKNEKLNRKKIKTTGPLFFRLKNFFRFFFQFFFFSKGKINKKNYFDYFTLSFPLTFKISLCCNLFIITKTQTFGNPSAAAQCREVYPL